MAELPLTIELIQGDLLWFSFVVAENRIECMTNFVLRDSTLHLVRLHLEATARNQVGRAALWQIARQIGQHFKAAVVLIEGGKRTTGLYKGKVPTPITIIV